MEGRKERWKERKKDRRKEVSLGNNKGMKEG